MAPQLPPEVQARIIAHAWYEAAKAENGDEWYEQQALHDILATVPFVCRAWDAESAKHLYRRWVIEKPRNVVHLANAVELRPEILRHITQLGIILTADFGASGELESLCEILGRLERLTAVNISWQGREDGQVLDGEAAEIAQAAMSDLVRALVSRDRPQLEQVDLRYPTLAEPNFCQLEAQMLSRLLSKAPSLRALYFSSVQVNGPTEMLEVPPQLSYLNAAAVRLSEQCRAQLASCLAASKFVFLFIPEPEGDLVRMVISIGEHAVSWPFLMLGGGRQADRVRMEQLCPQIRLLDIVNDDTGAILTIGHDVNATELSLWVANVTRASDERLRRHLLVDRKAPKLKRLVVGTIDPQLKLDLKAAGIAVKEMDEEMLDYLPVDSDDPPDETST